MPEPTQSNEPWRRQGPAEKAEYKAWVEALVEERWQKGIETYDPEELGFQGLPEDHAPEESLDGLFYNWYAKRRIKYLEGLLSETKAEAKAFRIIVQQYRANHNDTGITARIISNGRCLCDICNRAEYALEGNHDY